MGSIPPRKALKGKCINHCSGSNPQNWEKFRKSWEKFRISWEKFRISWEKVRLSWEKVRLSWEKHRMRWETMGFNRYCIAYLGKEWDSQCSLHKSQQNPGRDPCTTKPYADGQPQHLEAVSQSVVWGQGGKAISKAKNVMYIPSKPSQCYIYPSHGQLPLGPSVWQCQRFFIAAAQDRGSHGQC